MVEVPPFYISVWVTNYYRVGSMAALTGSLVEKPLKRESGKYTEMEMDTVEIAH